MNVIKTAFKKYRLSKINENMPVDDNQIKVEIKSVFFMETED